MDDILDILMGVDKKKEIFDLWYEITFLRMVMNKILEFNPELHCNLNEEVYEEIRKRSQDIVKSRFPDVKIDFSLPGSRVRGNQEPTSTLPEDESKRKEEEALASLRNGWSKHPDDIIEDQKEDPFYTPPIPE